MHCIWSATISHTLLWLPHKGQWISFMITEPTPCIIWFDSQYYSTQSAHCYVIVKVHIYVCVGECLFACPLVCVCVCEPAHEHLSFSFKVACCTCMCLELCFLECEWASACVETLQVCVTVCACRNGGETQVDRGTPCCVHTMCGRGAEMPFLATYM